MDGDKYKAFLINVKIVNHTKSLYKKDAMIWNLGYCFLIFQAPFPTCKVVHMLLQLICVDIYDKCGQDHNNFLKIYIEK